MLNFESDYTEGCAPAILERLADTNMTQASGYETDPWCASATEKIREACGAPDAEVFFLIGGTQTNAVAIDTALTMYEGVVAADTGHVGVHEAGAIEYTGHKVLTVPSHDGKVDPMEVDAYLKHFYEDGNHEHMVFPGMVYISHPTEYGTLYTKKELIELFMVCRSRSIPLYIDGARLGYGIMAHDTDVTLQDIAMFSDVFYIGGTKVGALCGEALVYPHGHAPAHMNTMIKQHGAMLAKGRLLGVQFDTLFTDHCYEKLSQNAIDRAEQLKMVLKRHEIPFYLETPTNQQFVILENVYLERLMKKVRVSFWERYDDSHTVVRLATSWATTEEQIRGLDDVLTKLQDWTKLGPEDWNVPGFINELKKMRLGGKMTCPFCGGTVTWHLGAGGQHVYSCDTCDMHVETSAVTHDEA